MPCQGTGNNVYVGARYVPLLGGQWDNTKTYEPLVIVQYQGASYTSKTYVPVGVDILNTTYWIETANYSAQVEEYRQEVKNVVGQMNQLPIAPQSNLLTVGAKGAQFTTINAAIDYAKTYCSLNNRVTIFLYPGAYHEQIILLPNPGIDFVGCGPYASYLDTSAVYPNSPLYTVGQGSFTGIGFNQKTGSSGNSYAFHFESQANSAIGNVIFKDCLFYSESNSAVGIGLGNSTSVQFFNCDMASAGNNYACVYAHNFPGNNISNQNLYLVNCRVNSYGYQYGVQIDDAAAINGYTNSTMGITFQNTASGQPKLLFKQNASTNLSYIPNTGNIQLLGDSINTNLLGLNLYEANRITGGIIYLDASGVGTIPIEYAQSRSYVVTGAQVGGTNVLSETTVANQSSDFIIIQCTNDIAKNAALNINIQTHPL